MIPALTPQTKQIVKQLSSGVFTPQVVVILNIPIGVTNH